jgi:predicted ArsR family transcriptional regulator
MLRGFAAGWTAERIARALLDESGETVAARTVARRAAEWRAEMDGRQARREHMADLVAAMKDSGMDGSEMIQALAIDQLMDHPEALTGADPIALHGMSLNAEQMRLKKREIDIRERRLAMDERRLAALEAREERARAALETQPGEEVTPEERLRRVQEIYGLAG